MADKEDYEHTVGDQLNRVREMSSKKQAIKRQLAYRSTSDPTMTPRLKRAGLNDIQIAQGIVQDAITKSFKLNEARLTNPMRTLPDVQLLLRNSTRWEVLIG